MKPQQPKAGPTNTQNSLDDLLKQIDLIVYNEHRHYINLLFPQIAAAINKTIMEARIDELNKCIEVAGEELYHGRAMAEDNDDGSLTYGVEEIYFKDRIAELTKKYGRADNGR